jgi:UDP-N-acetylmuramoyl-L-alanine---L-glutamate ligase
VKDNKEKSFIIVGFGFEGQCAFEYFKKKYPGARIAIADQKIVDKVPRGVETFFGKNYLQKIGEFDVIIKSPGIPSDLPEFKDAGKKNREITTATNLFFKEHSDRIIGVTGTKGKSTTATLIYKILKQAGKDVYLMGNIGEANPFEFLNNKIYRKSIFVYELSSYQLQDLRQGPHIAVFINIFPDHLPYHGTFANYKKAKANIVKYQKRNDYFIYNHDYEYTKDLAKKGGSTSVDYLKKCQIKTDTIYCGQEKVLDTKKIKLLGQHNQENICASICVARLFKIKKADIAKAVTRFTGLEHRLEFVKNIKGIDFYDDAISTTPESTLAAIEVFKDRLGTIILGGEDRGYNFKKLAAKIFELKIQNIVLFPNSGKSIWREIVKAFGRSKSPLPKKLETKKMAEAVRFAYKNTSPGQVCLLSTASPSYSVFKNFKEKGDLFKQEVRKLTSPQPSPSNKERGVK